MKYLIITCYDAWYNYQVNMNGIKYESNTDLAIEFYNKYWELPLTQFYEWIKYQYQDYDLIVYIEDADITILKGGEKNA
jgi:hypothetical protein